MFNITYLVFGEGKGREKERFLLITTTTITITTLMTAIIARAMKSITKPPINPPSTPENTYTRLVTGKLSNHTCVYNKQLVCPPANKFKNPPIFTRQFVMHFVDVGVVDAGLGVV